MKTPRFTRRSLAAVLAPRAVLAQTAAAPEDARKIQRQNAEAIAKVKVNRATEPAFRFQA